MTTAPVRQAVLSAAALLAALVLAACSGSDSVKVAAPATTGAAARQCAALQAALPGTLQGQKIRGTTPKSTNTAAWGSPAITLRCGVGMAGVLDPHSPAYDPDDTRHDAEEVNGVCWASEKTDGGGFRFTTIRQHTYVEVNVPGAYAGQQSPLGSLAGPVLRTDPTDTAAHPFDCL
ncbi:DUF3515 family protein [Streptacidiphilus sp. PAMC 29251]